VSHALTTNLGAGDLDATTLTDDALVTDALVLTAVALPVLGGTEDLLAEKAVLFRLQCAVVDRLGLQHLAVRPAADLLGRCQADLDCVEIIDVDHVYASICLGLVFGGGIGFGRVACGGCLCV
jgi:hypothetical protein